MLAYMLSSVFLVGGGGIVGWCEGVVYLTSPGCPTDVAGKVEG